MTEKGYLRGDALQFPVKGCELDLNPKQPDARADAPYFVENVRF